VRRALLLAAAAALAACGPKPSQVQISPAKATIYGSKKTAMLTGEIRDKNGHAIPGLKVDWSSSSEKVASVDGNGVVKSGKPGKATITAKYEALSGTAMVNVVDVARLQVTPGRVTIVGAKAKTKLTAEVFDEAGKPVAQKPLWSSSSPKIATVDAEGTVTAQSEGKAVVAATVGDFSGVCDVAVTFRDIASLQLTPATLILKAGESQLLKAMVLDAQGRPIEDAAIDWTSSDAGSATIYNGMVTGKAPGVATIHAACGPKTAEISVLVN
jgi:uncharacterized protein YjdB